MSMPRRIFKLDGPGEADDGRRGHFAAVDAVADRTPVAKQGAAAAEGAQEQRVN